MKKSDRQLGMGRDISRRDFLNGVRIAIGASLLPSPSFAQAETSAAQDQAGYYPPELTGLRGSHPGSFETAHLARDGASFGATDIDEEYDLVAVGSGLSGLSAAFFFQQTHGADARILILENHDDFGGHAKRNEFQIGGETIIGYGGTMSLVAPSGYPSAAKQLLQDLGVEAERFYQYFDREFYSSLGLKNSYFYDAETFGVDHLAVGQLADPPALKQAPLSDQAKLDIQRLFTNDRHYLPAMPASEQYRYLSNIDYLSYLRDLAGMDGDVLKVMLSHARGAWAVNIDAFPASDAWRSGYPGFGDLDIDLEFEDDGQEEDEPSIFHFPDGNASVARLLVRKMIPSVAAGNSMEDIVTTKFDYQQLDRPGSATRVRLNSTVVRAQHINNDLSNPVHISYLREGVTEQVQAKQVIMACYNQIIPHLCPEMSQTQKSALANCTRAPLVYTNVLIRNWRSFAELGIHSANCPGSFHHSVRLDYPVSMGGYQFSRSPDDPIVLHLTMVPGAAGLSAKEQFDAGKRELLNTSFETFERETRDQLSRMLSPGGFDAARDIAAITVNRWPHGYAYGHNTITDRIAFYPDSWPAEERVWETGRRSFGNISIASSDSASNAMTESAIGEAQRAVKELN